MKLKRFCSLFLFTFALAALPDCEDPPCVPGTPLCLPGLPSLPV